MPTPESCRLGLTHRRVCVLEYIASACPSVREVAVEFDITPAGALSHIYALEAIGMLTISGKSRGLCPTEIGVSFLRTGGLLDGAASDSAPF